MAAPREVFARPVPLCIRLPFLRGPLPEGLDAAAGGMPAAPGALRLWPGHRAGQGPGRGEVPAGWHCPAGYPFGQAEAQALLAAFAALDDRDLAGALDAADRAREERRARELGELADLAAFAGAPDAMGAPRGSGRGARLAAEQAQKLLLWLWLQEERLAELAELARGCARGLSALVGNFGEGAAEESAAREADGAELALHPGLVPPWRPAAAGAALFVGDDAVFFVEGPMREALLDALDFRPAPEWGEPLACAPKDAALLVAAKAPLWRVLGRQRPGGSESVRVWITWGRP